MNIGEIVWKTTATFDQFSKRSIELQWVRAADSIAANISEGDGRYSYKENKLFCYYARGTLYETRTWLIKARKRNLINETDCQKLKIDIETCGKMLNSYTKFIGSTND